MKNYTFSFMDWRTYRPRMEISTPSNSKPSNILYQLAVANDVSTLIDLDAALALSRSSIRALAAQSRQANLLAKSFAEEEICRFEMDESDMATGTIAIIRNALDS
ncbi:hypothetical protein [Asticcacaulis sp. AND118]|uniref:hypothetical protein n=1 Tax=Asticcacaulis sp. AND118 TaxID=2840468 RepID=UPI001D000CFB|nr:hypothetical protein [Asticcacaulis sp. AND118]UDF05755.1 hypothetical protein LH365_18510 [Asticcacaulis sp. AND118]